MHGQQAARGIFRSPPEAGELIGLPATPHIYSALKSTAETGTTVQGERMASSLEKVTGPR